MNFSSLPIKITLQNRALLKKLTVTRVIKKSHAYYENRQFITVLTDARQQTLSWATWNQSTPSHPSSLRSSSISTSHLHPDLSSCIFPWLFQIKFCIIYSDHFQTCYMPPSRPPSSSLPYYFKIIFLPDNGAVVCYSLTNSARYLIYSSRSKL
jgi:hypothetical protein